MLSLAAMAIALSAAGPVETQLTSPEADQAGGALSATALSQGRNSEAIAELEADGALASQDPGQLINLGIAYAREGEVDTARALFVAALESPEPIELETADGSVTDSRRLARKALRMLEAGVFAPQKTAERVSLRN